jgi:hypothetical protein
MIKESTEEVFKTDLLSSFKNLIPLSFKSPFNFRKTFFIFNLKIKINFSKVDN